MSYEPINIYVLDSRDSSAISGAIVRFYLSSGTAMVTQGVTDASGRAQVLLPDGSYEVRCYKFGIVFGAPTTIEVLEFGNNSFNVYGESVEPPLSSDNRLCMVYGYFRNEFGAPAVNVDIHVSAVFDPLILDGAAVMPSMMAARTDRNGYVQFTLIRNAQYNVLVQGMQDITRCISVPDENNANLPDLIFPVVEKVEFDVATPFSMLVDGTLEVTPTVTATSRQVLVGTAKEDVSWSVSDDTVVHLDVGRTVITLQGLKAGVSELRAVRVDTSIVSIPDADITGQPVTITVS
ncbi:MAG: hypothetical protein ACXABY_13435 [Candidatus Thorarchaeota archaeon]|jgi:hypothetical protein